MLLVLLSLWCGVALRFWSHFNPDECHGHGSAIVVSIIEIVREGLRTNHQNLVVKREKRVIKKRPGNPNLGNATYGF
ncbi:hypothetical protein ES319_D01G092600v1 [Gossypium barbadense]|uniref:Secreted protein n=1 Tax=Gossypium barbadense TaxID=3634 RepID=A0A5J5SSH4_GOSBA|nr:hypothetical protein ES319_D01G092600v1 [Gossypium barbadense]